MNGDFPYKVYKRPDLDNSLVLVGWDEDAGRMGNSVINYLMQKIHFEMFCEIEPRGFFPMNGVLVENDVALFPSSKFYHSPEKNIVILKSSLPRFEWFNFLNAALDVCEHICHVSQIYTIGGMISISSHTLPRTIMATMNNSRIKEMLDSYDLEVTMNYETPAGQRPTMSSFLLWAARQRHINGVSLWTPIPFYLVPAEDLRACRKLVDFINRRFSLGIDFSDLDEKVNEQNSRISDIVKRNPEIQESIKNLENNVNITEEEGQKLLKLIQKHLPLDELK